MKKKYKKIFKIFLALALAFSQLSNAMVVFADQIDNNEEEQLLGNTELNQNILLNANNEEDDIDREFTKEDLEAMMASYINETPLDEEIINLLIEYDAPSIEEGEFTAVTLEDIMFVNELLKEESDPETDREDNVNLKVELGEVPEEVPAGEVFNVEILISNENGDYVLVGDTDVLNNPTNEEEIIEDFIDGIEGDVTTSDNLRLREVKFTDFVGTNNEEGKFVGAGEEVNENGTKVVTLTFEALQEGEGEVTISGKLAKYLNINDFEDLSFIINVIAREGSGLATLTASIGSFDKEFDNETYEYSLTVPAGTEEVILSGSLVNEYDNVSGLSAYTLEEDETLITISITGFDGTEVNYIVKVIRETAVTEEEPIEEQEEKVETPTVATPVVYVYSSNNYLKSLSIKDYEINFEKGILEYKIKVPADVRTLDITAVAEDYRSRVEINGNENFEEGENTVTIKVTAENGEVREYKINVQKDNKDIASDSLEEEEESSGKTEKIVIIVLIVLVVAGLLYLIFVKDETAAGARLVSDTVSKNKKSKER